MAKSKATTAKPLPEGEKDGGEAGRILEDYLAELKDIHASGAGVPETSYYPALSNLFNAVGKTIKPKVRCIISISNQGRRSAGRRLVHARSIPAPVLRSPETRPAAGAGRIEVKGTKPEVSAIAVSDQVKDYLKTYGIVIVSNLRSFAIVECGSNGHSGRARSRSIWRPMKRTSGKSKPRIPGRLPFRETPSSLSSSSSGRVCTTPP